MCTHSLCVPCLNNIKHFWPASIIYCHDPTLICWISSESVLLHYIRLSKLQHILYTWEGECWAVLHEKVPNVLSRCHTRRKKTSKFSIKSPKNATWRRHEPTCQWHHILAGLNPLARCPNGHWDMIFGLVTFGLVTFGPVTDGQTDGQTDRQTESDAYEPTVHKHRWAHMHRFLSVCLAVCLAVCDWTKCH